MKFLKKYLLWFILGIIIIVLFIFSSLLKPVRSMVWQLTGPIFSSIHHQTKRGSAWIETIVAIRDLKRDNQHLSEKNLQLKAQIAYLQEVEHQNEILKKQLGFVQVHQELKLIPAKIINRSPVSFLQYLIISLGIKDQIKTGQAVIADGFLIGLVKEVYSQNSQVHLITDSNSIVPVILQQSRATGLLKGGIDGLKVIDIPQDIEIIKDEMVVTSGLGGQLPAGIAVGQVKEVISSQSEIFQRVAVTSQVEFNQLEIVFVVQQ